MRRLWRSFLHRTTLVDADGGVRVEGIGGIEWVSSWERVYKLAANLRIALIIVILRYRSSHMVEDNHSSVVHK